MNTCFTQQPAVLDGCVLKFAQKSEQSFDFPVSLLASTYLILQRDGVQLWLLAHPVILSAIRNRRWSRTTLEPHGTTPHPWVQVRRWRLRRIIQSPLRGLLSCYGYVAEPLFFLILAKSRSIVRTVTPKIVATSGFEYPRSTMSCAEWARRSYE